MKREAGCLGTFADIYNTVTAAFLKFNYNSRREMVKE